MTDEEYNHLHTCKKYIRKYLMKDTIIPIRKTHSNGKAIVKIPKNGKAFNDI
jgi:hypothetical protein